VKHVCETSMSWFAKHEL